MMDAADTLRKTREVRQKYDYLVRLTQVQVLEERQAATKMNSSRALKGLSADGDMQNLYSPWMQAELSVKADENQTTDDRQKRWRHFADEEQAAAGVSATSSASASPSGGRNEGGPGSVDYGNSSRQAPPDRRRSIAALVSSTVVRHPRIISTRTSLDSIKSVGSNSEMD